MCFAPQRRALFRHLNFQKCSDPGVLCTFWLGNVLRGTTAYTLSTSQLPKVFRSWCALCMLTSKCASRQNGVHFSDILTSKSAPNLVCFNIWLGNVLRATTACTFSTSQLPKVLRPWCVLHILTWECASRHNGVHFFDISTSKSVPILVCFVHVDFEMCFVPERRALFWHLNFQKWSETVSFLDFDFDMCFARACNFSSLIWRDGSAPAALASLLFDPPEPQIIGKTQCFVFRHFATFSRTCIFFPLTLSLLWSLLFFSSLLWLPTAFPSVHIVGSLTSKTIVIGVKTSYHKP